LLKSGVVVNRQTNSVLQPTKQMKVCGNVIGYETNEGFMIAGNEETLRQLVTSGKIKQAKNTPDIVNKLLVANIDFNELAEVERFRFMDVQICSTLGTILSLASRLNNQYFELINSKGQKAILFAKHGLIYAPECVKLENISVVLEIKDCYRELLVSYTYKEASRLGYLAGKVVREIAKPIDCVEDSDVIILKDKYMQRKKREVFNSDIKEVKWTKLNVLADNLKINAHHADAIMSSTNELEMFFELEKKMVGEHSGFAEPIPDELANNVIEKYIDEIKVTIMKPMQIVKNYIYIVGISIGGIVIILVVLIICCKTNGCGLCSLCGYCVKKLTWKKETNTGKNKRKQHAEQHRERDEQYQMIQMTPEVEGGSVSEQPISLKRVKEMGF
jgi:hypothetical protein